MLAQNRFEPTKYGGTMFLLFPYHETRNVEILLQISASIISVYKCLQTDIMLYYIYVYVNVCVCKFLHAFIHTTHFFAGAGSCNG